MKILCVSFVVFLACVGLVTVISKLREGKKDSCIINERKSEYPPKSKIFRLFDTDKQM